MQKRLTKGGAAGIITHVAGHQPNMWGISSAGSPVGIKTHPQSDGPATINSQQKTPSKRFASWILWGIMEENKKAAQKKKISHAIIMVVLILLFLMFIFPFILVIINAFKTKGDIMSDPMALVGSHGFIVTNFSDAMKKMNLQHLLPTH